MDGRRSEAESPANEVGRREQPNRGDVAKPVSRFSDDQIGSRRVRSITCRGAFSSSRHCAMICMLARYGKSGWWWNRRIAARLSPPRRGNYVTEVLTCLPKSRAGTGSSGGGDAVLTVALQRMSIHLIRNRHRSFRLKGVWLFLAIPSFAGRSSSEQFFA